MALWLYFGLIVLVIFAVLETFGVLRKFHLITLSESIRNVGDKYRFTIYLAGVFTGALAIHLFVCCNCVK